MKVGLNVRRVAALLACALPLALAAEWTFDRRVRVLAPRFVAGITCVTDVICTDDVSRATEAAKLYDDAVRFVGERVSPIQNKPHAIFCASEACFQAFGFERSSAEAVGRFGIILSPRGWQPH